MTEIRMDVYIFEWDRLLVPGDIYIARDHSHWAVLREEKEPVVYRSALTPRVPRDVVVHYFAEEHNVVTSKAVHASCSVDYFVRNFRPPTEAELNLRYFANV